MAKIEETLRSNRILKGNSVLHAFGQPSQPRENERNYRESMALKALKMLK